MSLERAQIHIQQGRWEQALEQLEMTLAQNTEDPLLLALKARCLLELEMFEPAEQCARQSISLAPRFDYAYFILGLTLYDRGHLKEALETLHQAIELDPTSPDYLGHVAYLYCELKDWNKALELAQRGLECDGGSTICSNAQARALAGLGKAGLARAGLETHLADDPHNPLTHANLGWLALEQGRHKQALEHFHTALEENPEMEWAREGLLEALRARNIVYRLVLGYFFWMARLSPGTQWGVILGGYVGYRLALQVSRQQPELAPYFKPFFILYVAFVYLTWVGPAASNLLLRFSRYGRQLLNKSEILETNLTGPTWIAAAVAFGAQAYAGGNWWIAGAVLLFQALFIATVFKCRAGWPRKLMIAIAATMSVLGLGGYILAFFEIFAGKVMLGLYVSSLLFVLVGANFLIGARVKR